MVNTPGLPVKVVVITVPGKAPVSSDNSMVKGPLQAFLLKETLKSPPAQTERRLAPGCKISHVPAAEKIFCGMMKKKENPTSNKYLFMVTMVLRYLTCVNYE